MLLGFSVSWIQENLLMYTTTILGKQQANIFNLYDSALKQNGVVLVGCGRLHTIACTKAGQLYAFGAGGEGQLGGGDTQGAESPAPVSSLDNTQYKEISCGTDHTAVLTGKGVEWVILNFKNVISMDASDAINNDLLLLLFFVFVFHQQLHLVVYSSFSF